LNLRITVHLVNKAGKVEEGKRTKGEQGTNLPFLLFPVFPFCRFLGDYSC
jgi:hypothetical protein